MRSRVPGADAAPKSATMLASGAGGRHNRFSTVEKRRRECAGSRAQCATMLESVSALRSLFSDSRISRPLGGTAQRVAGGATGDGAMQTGAQLSSDSEQHVHARRAVRVAELILGPSDSRPLGVAWHGAYARSANAWREGQPEMWRCKPAHGCRPTQDRTCKCGARCGAGSRTLAFLAPLVWHHGFKCSRPTRGRRGNARCGDATQSSSLVDYDKLRQGRGLSVGVAGFGTSNVEYLCSPALRTCGCECCVCVLCVRTCRCLL